MKNREDRRGVTTRARIMEQLRSEYAGVMDDARLAKFFDEYVEGREAELLVETLGIPPGAKLLDIGAGYGAFVRHARLAGITAFGLEPSAFESQCASSRAAEADGVRSAWYLRGDGRALPFRDDSYDVVTLWNILEHVPEWRSVVREAVRVLRPGGRLFGVAPNYAAFRREPHYHVAWLPLLPRLLAVRYLRVRKRDPAFFEQHVHYVTAREVRWALQAEGLGIRVSAVEKLRHPEQFRNPRLQRFATILRRAKLDSLAVHALALEARNPIRPRIEIDASKPS
jgi:SAM-dependent methyltransferase